MDTFIGRKEVQTFIIVNHCDFGIVKSVLWYAINNLEFVLYLQEIFDMQKKTEFKHFLDTLKDILKYLNRPALKDLRSVILFCSILVEKQVNNTVQGFDSIFYTYSTKILNE